jgi:hypothetical protein
MQGKLTGAGGGGFAFALIPPSLTEQTLAAVQQELTAHGYTCSQEGRCFCLRRLFVNVTKLPQLERMMRFRLRRLFLLTFKFKTKKNNFLCACKNR